jgi:hypothetical protein
LKASIACVGDMVSALGGSVPNLNKPFLEQLLREGDESDDESIRQLSGWSRKVIMDSGKSAGM